MKKGLVAIVAAVTLGAVGCHRGMHGGPSPEKIQRHVHRVVEKGLDEIDATDSQRTKAAELEKQLLADGMALREESQKARRELMVQLQTTSPDRTRVHAMVDERVEAYRKFIHQFADAALDFHGTLNPEQHAKLNSALQRFEKH